MKTLGGIISVDGQPVRGVVNYSVLEGWAIVTEKDENGRSVSESLEAFKTKRIHGVVSVSK